MTGKPGWKVLKNALSALELLADELGFGIEWEITQKGEGTKTMNMIQPQEGESMVDAMTRMAKEQVASGAIKAGKVPPISSGKRKMNQVSKKAASSKSPKPAQPDTKEQIKVDEGQPVDREVHAALHIYKRDGETDGKVRWNANHERELHGPGTLIFVHMHSFGEKCSSACKAKVEAE